jgi:DNA-binding NarL/FixJ family response regulator
VVEYRDWSLASSDAAASPQPAASASGAPSEMPAIVNRAKVAFTARERQVLATLLRGMSNKVIASELNLSQNTVKSHISRIMHKLHAKNRTEAVILSQFSASAANGGERSISDA